MGNFVFGRGKGRGTEFAERVATFNDPVNSVLVIDVLATSGIEADSVLEDVNTFDALVSGTTNWVTQAGVRKTLNEASGITIVYDDTNNRTDVDCPDQTWTAVAAGDQWNSLVFGYDSDSTAGTDVNIVPITKHDFVVTPDGSDITAVINVFYRAT